MQNGQFYQNKMYRYRLYEPLTTPAARRLSFGIFFLTHALAPSVMHRENDYHT